MNVLSLFDGMSCGQIALKNLGIQVDNYYAAEIDKYAITIAKKNHPGMVHLGDVRDLKASDLPQIDLILAGSPCQDLSLAGKGAGLDGEKSGLFYEFLRLLLECKPKYFLLENVRMKKEYKDHISELLAVEPIEINSALVSAQNRNRLYWTNIPNVTQPEDLGVKLRDIVEDGVLTDRDKSHCLDASYYKGGGANQLRTYINKGKRQVVFNDGCHQVGIADDINGHDIMKRIYSVEGKSPTLNAMTGGNREPKVAVDELRWRKLTPLECERLQTVPDGYTEGVSNTQRYKMLGNGWTVKVIEHILQNIK
jgi:DNA-cytosine methyltransferase